MTCQIVATTSPDLSLTKSVNSPTQTVSRSKPLTAAHLCIMYNVYICNYVTMYVVGDVARWLGRQSVAGGLSLIYA